MLERENAFLEYKNEKSKVSIFPSFHFCLEKEKNVFHEKTPF